jgi:rare lipoprotein A
MQRWMNIAALVLLLLTAPLPALAGGAECKPGKVLAGGMASWYGGNLQGKRDARGKRFDMNAMTAAHRTLPLGSFVEVTNSRTHRTVVVKITDRGPYSKGRVIDVSKAAAHELGFGKRGVMRVTLRACGK